MKKANSKFYDDDDYDDGGGDDYDDDYYYEDEEEEEEHASSKNNKNTKTTTTTTAANLKPTTTTTKGSSTITMVSNKKNNNTQQQQQETAEDQELLDQMLPILKSSMSEDTQLKNVVKSFSESTLIEILRKANYDILDTLVRIKLLPPPSSTSSASASGNKTGGGGGKVLSIGGGSSNKSSKFTTPANSFESTTSAASASASAASASASAVDATATSSQNNNKQNSKAQQRPKCSKTEEVHVGGKTGKTNLALVFTGHVDHGKSTTVGHLLFQLGYFSDKEVQKMDQLARRSGKNTFHFAWLLDQSDEERRRGVTIDSGVHAFETDQHAISLLDAPGHEQFIENMASSSSQADVAVLVISGKPDELAVGLEHSTKAHAQILRRLGVAGVLVAINKMDAVDYSQDCYREACEKTEKLLLDCKFTKEEILGFIPISGLMGVNLVHPPSETPSVPPSLSVAHPHKHHNNNSNDSDESGSGSSGMDKKSAEVAAAKAAENMKWYEGPTLVEAFNKIKPASRMLKYPLRFVVLDVQKEHVTGKVETGSVSVGDTILFYPSHAKVTVRSIEHSVAGTLKIAQAGDHVELRLNGDVAACSVGNIGCPVKGNLPPVLVGNRFEALIQTYGVHAKAILPGHRFILMINGVQLQGVVKKLIQKMNMTSGNWSVRGGMVKMVAPETQARVLIEVEYPIPFERAEDCRQLGRFLMRQEGAIVGGGFVEDLPLE